MPAGEARIAANAAVVAEAECDHETVDVRPGPKRGHLTHAIPPSVRRAIMHRDGYRCAVQGCGTHVWYDVHHIQTRESGGNHDESNLTVICTLHHCRVHDGLLRVWRDERGVLCAEPIHEAPPAGASEVAGLLDVLSFTVLDTWEVAQCMGLGDGEARRLLGWLERRGQIVGTPGGGWHRLAA